MNTEQTAYAGISQTAVPVIGKKYRKYMLPSQEQ